MSSQELSKTIFDRLEQQYGSLLTHDELAQELRISPNALYNRRSRGRTGGMPDPLNQVHPLQYRTAEIARWLAGEEARPKSMQPEDRRRPGRPRNVPEDPAARSGLGGVRS